MDSVHEKIREIYQIYVVEVFIGAFSDFFEGLGLPIHFQTVFVPQEETNWPFRG